MFFKRKISALDQAKVIEVLSLLDRTMGEADEATNSLRLVAAEHSTDMQSKIYEEKRVVAIDKLNKLVQESTANFYLDLEDEKGHNFMSIFRVDWLQILLLRLLLLKAGKPDETYELPPTEDQLKLAFHIEHLAQTTKSLAKHYRI